MVKNEIKKLIIVSEKIIYNADIQYIRGVSHYKYISNMHNLITNFDKFIYIVKSVYKV